MNSMRVLAFAIVLFALPSSAVFAHPGHFHSGQGISEGLMHPLFGLDHLLAMVAVGILSAQLGGRAIWLVPGAFVASMVGGGIVGMNRWEVASVELGIAGSIILFGLAVAINRRVPVILPVLLVCLFGCFHGYAHGLEMPPMASYASYAMGFVVATVMLHAVGIVAARFALDSAKGATGLRIAGASIAAAGVCFALMV